MAGSRLLVLEGEAVSLLTPLRLPSSGGPAAAVGDQAVPNMQPKGAPRERSVIATRHFVVQYSAPDIFALRHGSFPQFRNLQKSPYSGCQARHLPTWTRKRMSPPPTARRRLSESKTVASPTSPTRLARRNPALASNPLNFQPKAPFQAAAWEEMQM